MKLWHYIREKMLDHPDQRIIEGDVFMTYEEMCIFAENYAKKLTAPYYAILCNSEMASAMALLACFAAGKTAIPLPTRYGEKYYKKILDKADPPALISDFSGELQEIIFDSIGGEHLGDSTAVILFTSGSTGTPKGVMLSEENLISNLQGISMYLSMSKQDKILIARPLYHSSVLTGEFLVALNQGANIVFSSEPFQPLHILRMIKKHHITVFGSTPTLLSTLSRFARDTRDVSSVRLISVSGELMSEGMAKQIRQAFPKAKVYCGYGLTEASPRVAFLPAELFDETPTVTGRSLRGVSMRIVDNGGEAIWESNKIGELWVKGDNIMQGYFRDAKKTQKTLTDGWLHTGDLAFWNEDDLLCICGRKDDMIIRAGMNIYPAEVENAISADPRVKDVLVYGYKKDSTQEVGMKISGDFLCIDEIIDLCKEKLPSFQIPSKIEIVDENAIAQGGKKRRKNF